MRNNGIFSSLDYGFWYIYKMLSTTKRGKFSPLDS